MKIPIAVLPFERSIIQLVKEVIKNELKKRMNNYTLYIPSYHHIYSSY